MKRTHTMKNRWTTCLLFAAFAAFAVPAGADTLSCTYSLRDPYPISTGVESGGVPIEWPFQVIREDLSATRTVRATSDDVSIVKIKAAGGSAGETATVRLARETTRVDGDDTAEFFLVAVAPGNAIVTVKIDGDNDPEATVEFKVVVTGIDTTHLITFVPDSIDIAEGDSSSRVTVQLGSPVTASKTINLALAGKFGNPADYLSIPDSVTVPANTDHATFKITTVDGDYDFTITATDESGEFSSATLIGSVTNRPPNVSASTDPEKPTPWGVKVVKNQKATFTVSAVGATDISEDTLTYQWSFAPGDKSSDPSKVWEYTWTSASPEDSPYIIYCDVWDEREDDPTRSEKPVRCYFSVEVLESVTLYTDTESPLQAMTYKGGIAQNTTFAVISPSGQTWIPIDAYNGRSEVTPKESVVLGAVLEEGSYPFAWFSKEDSAAVKSPSLRVPNSHLRATIQMPEEESVLMQYLASYPYYHVVPGKGALEGLNNVHTDPFGDFDADALSDSWEDLYFQDGMDTTVTEPNDVTKFPVGMATGDYGTYGNLDEDWLPTLVEEAAPDATDAEPKAGWPEIVSDPTTGELRTNRVFVLKYPLDFSSGSQTYNKSEAEEKPLFYNAIEYRGLREDRTGGDGTDPLNLVRYAPALVSKGADRNNCSGTDPQNADTDADGLSDGWEWYFWTTVKYGVHSENWRCWDPSYTYYSTDSALAGFPMLETGDPLDYSFDVEPTRGYDIDPAAGTYRTSYAVDDKLLGENDVVLPVVPGSVTVEFSGSSFALYTLSRGLAAYLGLNAKDENGNSRLFYMLYADTDDDGIPDAVVVNPDTGYPELEALPGAWVNDLNGNMSFPGWQKLVELADTVSGDITQDTVATVSFKRQNGIFPKQFLVSRFDPMNWDEYLAGDIAARVSAAGLNPKYWDPYSDLDGDGLLDVEEYFLGTDPLHWDTDRDGMPDGWEVQKGLLPRDPRSGVNDCGPGDNPDEDYMAWDATGTAKHADAYRADLANEVFWNGKTFTGYRPGRAVFPSPSSFTMEYKQGDHYVTLIVMTGFGGGGYGNREEFLYSFYGVTHGWWSEVYPVTGGDAPEWASTTTDPCNNDSDGDGCPDGWEAYVGYSPLVSYDKSPEDLVEGLGYEFDPTGRLEQPPVCMGPPGNPDIDFDEETDLAQEFRCLWANQLWPETVKKTIGDGTEVTVNALGKWDDWYNKWMPTDPWNADTDGDGVTDYLEYTDAADRNKDGEPLCNFNPTSADTDLDWLPDGWEWFMGNYGVVQVPNLENTYLEDEYGPFGDPDGDGLPNYQEYLTGANYGWRHDMWYPLSKENIWVPQRRVELETHKWDLTNPWDWPYDPGRYPDLGPVVRAHVYSPVDFFSVPVSGTTIARGMEVLKTLEKRWGYTVEDSPSMEMETLAARLQRAYEIIYNPTAARAIPVAAGNPERAEDASLFLYDTDPLYDPVYNYDMMPVLGKQYFVHHSKAEHDAIVALFENVPSWIYSYAQRGYGWDLAGSLLSGGVYIPLNDNSTGYGFSGTRPNMVDSDNDGMPDYWEIYHGLNPIYGGSRLIGKSGETVDSDRADVDGMGDGSTDNWIMGCDPDYVLDLHFAMRAPYAWPIARKAKVGFASVDGDPWSFDDAITTAFGPDMAGNYIMEWAHYDLVNRPWLSGDKSADCDKDGLNNQEEAYSFFANDLLHHTDPSPYWLTDMSQTVSLFGQNASHVNLYYQGSDYGAAQIWWWAVPFDGGVTDSPQYVWDFETNEGFDTDNNNICDREELVDTSVHGKTDPLDFDSPRARKAMYFDGHAACRTQRPFFHDQYALTSHTVEFWVRPHSLPAPGRYATLLHRPVMMPVDTLSGSKAWTIRNTFHLYLDDTGRLYAEVDNDAVEQPANRAVVASAGRLVPDNWTHVAMVMDSVGDLLTLYVNGEVADRVATSLKPCTGTLMSGAYQEWVTSDGTGSNAVKTVSTTTVNFDYSPAPIVLGAYDRNPWGVVGGKLWGKTEPQFDENRFFDGWIDEVRIWDRCRSHSEILNNMSRRFTGDEVARINQARWKWDKEHLYATNAVADFPQKLLYHYTFDNMPDVLPAADRDAALLFPSDTDPVPFGWSEIASVRPLPFVPWWYVSDNRSTVYATDFSVVPFAENTAGHVAQRPSRDIGELIPVYDEAWNLLSYRYRRSTDWVEEREADIVGGGQEYADVTYVYEGDGEIDPSRLVNSANPYGDGYNTHVRGSYEYNPWNFGGALDLYGVYEGIPIHSDLVPLLDAVADMDVSMWDGNGPGYEVASVDTDGDGLPDWWEIAHGLDPNSASGTDSSHGDPDDDGLDNYAEYLAGTDPYSYDTDSDGYSDYYSRADGQSLTWGELYDDGDGMDNAWELEHGLDPERYDAENDYDADGWTNLEEFMAGTNPARADEYPDPSLNVKFYYDGKYAEQGQLYVYTYGEKRSTYNYAGDDWYGGPIFGTNNWGGAWNGRYYGKKAELGHFSFDKTDTVNIGNESVTTMSAKLGSSDISTADPPVITVNRSVAGRVSYAASAWETSDDYYVFVDDDDALMFLDYRNGIVHVINRDPVKGEGRIYGDFTISYVVSPRTYPLTINGMERDRTALLHQHMVSGYNRFFGWLDLDGNAAYDVGEPAGVSRHRPTLVSWDAVDAEIPLTDELWDFPRVSWIDAEPYGISPDFYSVTFSYQIGSVSNSTSAVAYDPDLDGLDEWAEAQAGTDPDDADTGDTGYSDYYKVDPATGRTYGELYDDGDGMPNGWERNSSAGRPVSLDSDRYDATEDPDVDGWTNWEEYMAGTDPTDSGSFPVPKFDATFDYAGTVSNMSHLVVYSYAEKTKGVGMGGAPDGEFSLVEGISFGQEVFGSDGLTVVGGHSYYANFHPGYKVSAATFTIIETQNGTNTTQTYELPHSNDEYGWIMSADGSGSFGLQWDTGTVISQGSYVGKRFSCTIMVDGYNFPLVEQGLLRRKNTRLVSGWNRFFGFADANGNGVYDVGEPAGLSISRPSLVSYDTATATIPLSDGLFGYPRFSWPTSSASENGYYTVQLYRQTDSVTNIPPSVAADPDLDGLDEWAETQAGTDPDDADTGDTGYSDYYKVDPATGLTYGELYDDGDGMPNDWERNSGFGRSVSLDSDRYDATEDPDVDGWTNWEEYMAGTDPTDAGSFPVPKFDVTFDYAGSVSNMSHLVVYSYAEKTAGEGMSGNPDGEFSLAGALSFGQDFFGRDGLTVVGGNEYYANFHPGYKVSDATFTIVETQDGTNTTQTYELPHSNDEYGWIMSEDGSGFFGLQWDTGTIISSGSFVGKSFTCTIMVDGYNFPFTEQGLLRRKNTHLVSGWNRFFGFADANLNGVYDVGEPAGLSIQRPSLVSYDTATATIPLSDGLFGYPRFSWPTNNASENGYYTVQIYRERPSSGGFDVKVAELKIAKPRNFVHEGDLIANGVYGLPFGTAASASFYWVVFDGDDTGSSLANQIWPVPGDENPRNSVTYNYCGLASEDNIYGYAIQADTGRRVMEAVYPKNGETVHGPIVDFRWTMDHRTEGAVFKIRNLDTGKTYISNRLVPVPWRHGVAADGSNSGDYPGYYSATPQLENGKKLVELPSGRYEYTITERVDTSALSHQSVRGVFTLENGTDSRNAHSIAGKVFYWGRVQNGSGASATFPANVVLQAYRIPDGASSAAAPSGNPVAETSVSSQGDYAITGLEDGTYSVLAFVDSNGNGWADDWETQGYGVLRGTASPTFYVNPAPIVVTNADVEPVSVVLHDRDTDNDKLPDAWEWKKWGSLDTHYGAETASGTRTWLDVYAAEAVGAPAGTPFFFPEGSEGGLDMLGLEVSAANSREYDTKVAEVRIAKPRNFFHEGDLVANGIHGLPFGYNTAASFYWVVYDGSVDDPEFAKQIWPVSGDGDRGEAVTYNFEGVESSETAHGYDVQADTGRRVMTALYPKDGETVHGPVVDFRWTMDHRTEGAVFTIRNLDDGKTYVSNLCVALPWRHGSVADGSKPDGFPGYYSAQPQLENGAELVELPSGRYEYVIAEWLDSSAVARQSVAGSFVLENEDASQDRHAISGEVYYWGRIEDGGEFPADVVLQAFKIPDRATSAAAPSGNPVSETRVRTRGGYAIHGLVEGTYSVLAFVDSNGNGRADDWETQGYGVLRGTASPTFYGNPAPLVMTNADFEPVSVVLHDRDTDNDKLPDAWEWKMWGSLDDHYGSETASGSTTWLDVYADESVGAPADTPFFFPAGSAGGLDMLDLTVTPVTMSKTFYVRAPRNFLHEGDFEDAGFFGFHMGAETNAVVEWQALAYTSYIAYLVGSGELTINAGAKRDRRQMKLGYPDQRTAVVGENVEFEWEMDWRNAGVEFKIERLDDEFLMKDANGDLVLDAQGKPTLLPYAPTSGSTWTTYFSGIVPFPVRHGNKTNQDYYWSAIPQMEDGRGHVDLPAGYYRYRITERPMTDAYAAQSVEGTFQILSEGNPKYDLYRRYLHSASGSIQYFGKVQGGLVTNAVVHCGDASEIAVLDGVQPTLDATYDGEVVRGSMVVELVSPDGDVIDRLNDRATNVEEEGRLHAESGIDVWSGSIVYPHGATGQCTIHLVFDSRTRVPPAGTVVKVGVKRFKSPIVVQAFKLPDNATTSVSISGQPVAQQTLETKGEFKFESLTQGNYAFRAFVDSNGNGAPDEWETQGVAVESDTVSPNLSRDAGVISVVSDVSNLLIVLHDRDTDNDLLPDAWEYEMWGSVSAHSGYDASGADGILMLWQEYADGPLDSDPRTPDTDLDGLTDAMELLVTGTDTHFSDTDADGVGDLEEFLSGSDPLDPEVAVPWTVPGLEFDENGAPYVDCAYPALPRGVVLTYVLQRKSSLSDTVWEDVDELVVAATNAVLTTLGDGVSTWGSPAGSARMAPADKLETADWKSGFFRVRVFADYGKMVDNGDGTFSFWTWTEGGASFVEVARGEGTLVRDAEGNWSFVDKVSFKAGSLVRRPDGTWSFVR